MDPIDFRWKLICKKCRKFLTQKDNLDGTITITCPECGHKFSSSKERVSKP